MSKPDVLIVEDDSSIRALLHAFLEEEGYRVYEAPDGKQALERLRTHPEGLVVLLDLLMPADGLATLQAVAAEAPLASRHAYILMTAAAPALPEQVRPLLQRLNVEALPKPFDLSKLGGVIQQAAHRLGQAE
jgi:two-component system response regulator FlrC